MFLLLIFPLLIFSNVAWCFFPTNVGDNLVANMVIMVVAPAGTATATPILVQPDGYTIAGTPTTIGTPGGPVPFTLTLTNPEIGTYFMGVELANATDPITVTMNNIGATTLVATPSGFNSTYEATNPAAVTITAGSLATELLIPVAYLPPNYPP
jgi:hypothetical protein